MSYDILHETTQRKQAHQRRKRWGKIVSGLAAVVVFCTTYALILPAITLDKTAACGMEEHTHEESCYGIPDMQQLTCVPAGDLVVHTHGENCVDAAGNQVCTLAEVLAHTHTDECYTAQTVYLCGMEPGEGAHTHTEDCCRTDELICELPEQEAHAHGESCYTVDSELICQLAEVEAHTHGEDCYESASELICTQQAQEAHSHDDSCYTAVSSLICPLIESEEHAHGDGCYESANQLTCTLPETEGHAHVDSCYTSNDKLVCQSEETTDSHAHSDECYNTTSELTCTLPECEESHSHAAACYVLAEEPLCGLEESEGHVHDDTCPTEIQNDLVCTQQEIILHTHDESCLDESGAQICGKTEVMEHIHDENCSTQTVPGTVSVLTCGMEAHIHEEACYPAEETIPAVDEAVTKYLCESGEHTHGEGCYDENGSLICTVPQHTHSATCITENVDLTADVETAEQWEATFADVELTGNWAVDALAIAETQMGYTESTKNVILVGEKTLHGYTRYGDWYGDHYGDWCAMFVSFCLDYAGVEGYPLDSNCQSWIAALKELGVYYYNNEYTPKPGDIIFFDWERRTDAEGEIVADHVGLVAALIHDEEGNLTQIKTIEGNSGDRVQYVTYDLTDQAIIGYGQLPENPEINYNCGLKSHTHGVDCYDEESNLICGCEEHVHSAECNARKLIYKDDMVQVSVTILGVEDLPTNLDLEVWPITLENNPDTYGSMQVALSEQITTGSQYVGTASFYQMQLLSDGVLYELPENADVRVNMTFTNPVFTPEDVADSVGMHTFMLTPSAQPAAPIEETEPVIEETEPVNNDVNYSILPLSSGEKDYVVQLLNSTDLSEEDTSENQVSGTYQATAADGENYENTEQGVTGISFQSNSLTAFAVALATETQTGNFWERVTSTDQITSGGTYMIVSAEGNYALRGNSSNNYTAVRLQTVKGNTNYYTIDLPDGNAVSNEHYWTLSGSGNNYTIQNQGTSRYLNISQNTIISNYSNSSTLSYITPENCWRIASGNYYLRNQGSGVFSHIATSTNDGSGNGTSGTRVYFYYTRDMLIFKQTGDILLNIPSDVTSTATTNNSGTSNLTKPDYDAFISPSLGKTGETSVTNATDRTEATITVQGRYFSDTATSDLEAQYRYMDDRVTERSFADSQAIDGKVITDKSVIYRDDDYDAFTTYPANTFGITLSALGQDYPVPEEYIVKTPVDVVFVLDVSGSMKTTVSTGGATRMQAMSDAFNDAVTHILAQHPANRVGMVIYSTGAWEMLPLDRYTADDTNNDGIYDYTEISSNYIIGTDSLKNSSGKTFNNIGSDATQGIGTYTQAGIALGHKVFKDIGTDVTYTTTVGEGENARTYTVPRQPVFILLSDGEPTHATNHYMDVLNGPHYGDGLSDETVTDPFNPQGIMGYYTILSANYYKRMVAIQYNTPALFYTIGMGINETGDEPLVQATLTGDNYKRAVLNPTPEVIENLTSTTHPKETTTQMKYLLLNQFRDQIGSQALTLRSQWPDTWIGVPHVNIPVLQNNPYTGNYSYADDSYFGRMTSDDLKNIFSDILESSTHYTTYGFILYQNSSVELVDNIGEGMEIKGTPVLRYGGTNYSNPTVTVNGNVTTYTYTGTYTDPYIPDRVMNLSEIIVTVTTNDGVQTVNMVVPDTVLPTYTPEIILGSNSEIDTTKSFYYEALPVRLIYQVGLTSDSEAKVLALQETGGSLTFYTNQWDEENIAYATLLPSTANPYYYNADGTAPYHAHTMNKGDGDNLTETLEYSTDCFQIEHSDETIIEIRHMKGNNGKLVFEAEAPKVIDIPVEKVWDNVPESEQTEISVTLYSVTEATDADAADVVTLIQTIKLKADGSWKGTFEDVDIPAEGTYYCVSENITGFTIRYDNPSTVTINEVETAVGLVEYGEDGTPVTLTITNIAPYELPETGGIGTQFYLFGGLMIIAAALILGGLNRYQRRKEARNR